jgi:hypothetical protein
MNKIFITMGLILLFTTIAFAADPQINDVTYNQPFINKQTTFTIHLNPDGLQGIVRFVDNGTLITQQSFDEHTTELSFSYAWNVKETRTLSFSIIDLNDTDTNTQNNVWTKNVDIKKGLDLTIKDVVVNPTTIPPNEPITFSITIENVGDENYVGTIPIDIVQDGEIICSETIENIGIEEKTIDCIWVSPQTTIEEYEFIIQVNRNALIPELTLTNNSFIYNSLTAPKPNLYIKSIIVPQNIRRSSVVNLGIIIGNEGGLKAENVLVNIYLSYEGGQKSKVYYKTLDLISPGSEKGFDFVNIFESVGEYSISIYVDEDKQIPESNENDNLYSYKITVYDFNVDDVFRENDQLRRDLSIEKGKTESCLVKKKTYMEDVLRKENEIQNCQSNLNICNENNSTKIANWLKEVDGNQEALIQIMRSENDKLIREKSDLERTKNIEIELIQKEKSEWAMLVVIGLMLIIGWITFNEYSKRKPKKSTFIQTGVD